MAKKTTRAKTTGKHSRKQAAERIRREHARKERRKNLLIFSAVGVVALSLVGGAVWGVRVEREAAAAPIEELQKVEDQEADHVPEPIPVTALPPTGGDHSSTVQNCGIYTESIGSENAVHSLEHGAVWITYRPGLPSGEVDRLTQVAQGKAYTLLSPYPDLASPVVVSAWGRQLKLPSAEDPRLERFLKRFVRGNQAPEPGAPCDGGIGNPI